MPRPGEVRQPRLALCLGLVAAAAACCTRSATAVPAARGSDSGDTAAAPFACGSSGDAAADSTQVISLFSAAKSVCCDELGEQCEEGKPLPVTCSTAGCARAVSLVKQSCAAAFASDGFLGTAFGPSLAAVFATCESVGADPTPAYVITDPELRAAPTTTCHGRVIDSAASEFLASNTGQDTIVLQAPRGMQLQVTVESMHFSPHGNVRVYDGPTIDDPQLGLLRGTSMPEQAKDREFVSSKGALTVMRAVDLHDDAGLPLMFSLLVECVCSSDGADGCGTHGSCVNGVCTCDEGYGGGMCDTIVDKCKIPVEVDCGAHGSCVDGSCGCESAAYSGDRCQHFDKCYGIHCGAHGDCVNGNCECKDRYTGPRCTTQPLQCCSNYYTCGYCNSEPCACFCDHCEGVCAPTVHGYENSCQSYCNKCDHSKCDHGC
jgi:hypothetical protein